MFQPVGQNTKGDCFGLGDGVVARFAVSHCARDFNDFGYPATVAFLFRFDVKPFHSQIVQYAVRRDQRRFFGRPT